MNKWLLPMELWTSPTPNGWKINIMIEELIEAGVDVGDVEIRMIDLMKGEQFRDDFTARNLNSKIPVLRDGELDIMESCAILQYLAEKYASPLLPSGQKRWEVIQWLYWQAANMGPVFGNKLSYTRYMDDVPPEEKRHPLERFGNEAQRLLRVLDRKLGDNPWVCGEDFTLADIAIYPWARGWKWSKVDITGYPRIMNWIDRVRARPGVGRGLAYGVPEEEIDQWSEARKKAYAGSGATIARNENLDPG